MPLEGGGLVCILRICKALQLDTDRQTEEEAEPAAVGGVKAWDWEEQEGDKVPQPQANSQG